MMSVHILPSVQVWTMGFLSNPAGLLRHCQLPVWTLRHLCAADRSRDRREGMSGFLSSGAQNQLCPLMCEWVLGDMFTVSTLNSDSTSVLSWQFVAVTDSSNAEFWWVVRTVGCLTLSCDHMSSLLCWLQTEATVHLPLAAFYIT